MKTTKNKTEENAQTVAMPDSKSDENPVTATAEPVAESSPAATDDSATDAADAAPSTPTMGDVLRIAALDKRVGHYIIDLLSGMNQDEAFAAHFPTPPSDEETAASIADAEQRGYLRGRNERIELEMREPARRPAGDESALTDCTDDFLSNPRPKMWN